MKNTHNLAKSLIDSLLVILYNYPTTSYPLRQLKEPHKTELRDALIRATQEQLNVYDQPDPP